MFSECRLGGLEAPTVEDSWDGSELANSVPPDSKETLLSFISNLKGQEDLQDEQWTRREEAAGSLGREH